VTLLSLDSAGETKKIHEYSTKQAGVAVTFYTCIQEVLSLNLDRNTDYPEVIHGKCRVTPGLGHDPFLQNLFSVHYSPINLSFIVIQQ
jgi:hypothetical protein